MQYCFYILMIGFLWPLDSYGQQGKVRGTVSDKQGQPLPYALVYVADTSVGTQADAVGAYEWSLEVGHYTIVAKFVGYEPKQQVIEIKAGETIVVDFELVAVPHISEEVLVVGQTARAVQQAKALDASFFEENTEGTFSKSLERLAGVNAINVGVGIAKPVIRGLSANRIVVNNYGVKQEGQQWGNDHGLEVDQFGVERVEVLKGAASLQYGSDALGGAINILPNKITPTNTLSGSILGIYKSNNHHGGFSAVLKGNVEGFFFEGRVSYQNFEDYRVPTDSFVYNSFVLPIYNQQLKNTAGIERNLQATVGLVKDWGISRLTFSQYYLNVGIFSGAVGIPRAYALTDDKAPRDKDFPSQQVNHIRVVWNNDLRVGKHRLKINVGYQYNDRKEFSYPHFHNRPPVDSSGIALRLQLHTASLNAVFEHHWHPKWESRYGGNVQYQYNRRAGFEFLLPDFRLWRAGLFLINDFRPNKRWLVTFGGRLDYGNNYTADYDQAVYDQNQEIVWVPRATATQQHFVNFAIAAGLNYEWWKDHLWLRLNLGKSYRMPHPSETVSNGIHHGTFRHEQGTPNLKAENGYQVELATDWKGKRWQLQLAAYANYFDQYIYLGPTAAFSPLPEAGQIYKYQQSNAFYAGGELAWEWEVVRGLKLQQAFDYVWNINLETGLGLPFTPPASLLSEARYHFPRVKGIKDWYIKADYRYTFAQSLVDRNEPMTPDFHLLNIGVGVTFKIKEQPIQLGVQVRNLLDVAYLNHLSRYRILNIPEQGRNVVVTLKVPFFVPLAKKK